MNKRSRVKSSLLNLRIVWIWQLIYMVVKFVSRRFFSQAMPVEYLGVESLYTNLIGILDIAELGITTAVTSALYMPLAKGDNEAIGKIMATFASFYRVIAGIIVCIGLIITPFITLISSDLKGLDYIHITFLLYLLASVLSYIWGYKSILLTADQRNYVYVRNHYVCILFQNVIQVLVLLKWHSFMGYVIVMFIARFIEYGNISRITNNIYPFLKGSKQNNTQIRNKILNDVKQVAVGKIGNSIIQSTDSIIISNVLGLYIGGLYSNYWLIISSTLAIIIQFPNSLTASIGNMVAESNETKINNMFWIIFLLNTSLFAVSSVLLGVLVQPFIDLWLGDSFRLQYIGVAAYIVVFFLSGIRSQLNSFKTARGLFQYESIRSVLECGTNLLISIILAHYIGLVGVALGTIISSFCIGLPIELYNLSKGYNINMKKYLFYIAYLIISMLLIWFVCLHIQGKVLLTGIAEFAAGSVSTVVIFTIIWIVLISWTPIFKMTANYVRKRLK